MATREIWSNRITKELELLQARLPRNARVAGSTVDRNAGVCTLKVLLEAPNTHTDHNTHAELHVDAGFDTGYPFQPPVINVTAGIHHLPSTLLSRSVVRINASEWTPSNTLTSCIASLHEAMQKHAAEVPDRPRQVQVSVLEPGTVLRRSAIEGDVFECQRDGRKILLVVNDLQVLEAVPHPRQDRIAVAEAHSLEGLEKLKFKRGESVTLIYKSGVYRRYHLERCSALVESIRTHMQARGIMGTTQHNVQAKTVSSAEALMEKLREVERQFLESPSIDLVQSFMDIQRECAEKFGEVGDKRFEEVVQYGQSFLRRSDVCAVLESGLPQHQPTDANNNPDPVAEGPAETKVTGLSFEFLESAAQKGFDCEDSPRLDTTRSDSGTSVEWSELDAMISGYQSQLDVLLAADAPSSTTSPPDDAHTPHEQDLSSELGFDPKEFELLIAEDDD